MLRIARFLGWRCQRGTVFLAEPPYHADSEFILSRFLLKIAVLGMLGYGCYYLILNHFGAVGIMALGVILLAVFASGVFAILLSQILSLVVSSTRGGGNKPVAVRDLRLRDDEGDEHSIRCRGELRSGSISVGDDVLVWGMDRGGMLMVRFGWNYRTRTRINVRYR